MLLKLIIEMLCYLINQETFQSSIVHSCSRRHRHCYSLSRFRNASSVLPSPAPLQPVSLDFRGVWTSVRVGLRSINFTVSSFVQEEFKTDK